MKTISLSICSCILLTTVAFAQKLNTLTSKEKKDGWELLFDGKSTDGWHTYHTDKASNAWSVQDGALVFNPAADKSERGDLVTDKEYENYDLTYEWKISDGGNSGVIFGVKEDAQYGATYETGIEMQVLDNINADDRHTPNHLAGSLYDLIGSAEVSKPKAVGEWNQARILYSGGQITLWLNGVKTAEVKKGSEEWNQLIANSKFHDWEGFAKYDKGKIALQDHGDVVAYRNIKIKQL
ncbi:DUF1080 domain-containing protein [Olivibacter sp. SDN3]|uniref:3-keto-disaccharide hydrolase n=1 Tax=Olivibacter sp. SDN3 TaxID=2764720 RepID=UPI0016511D2D|nr:DUF1080 domain-containing protein [Olivibacter sp. SDN3]QNL49676.1 DUF1080 domain-containing protein [Olivibacter sp. SDN3]